jgi:hypothetical protein
LNLASGFAVVQGAISPAGDQDYYSFVAPANARVWAFVDSGGLQSPEAESQDSFLTLLAGNGTTIIEEDDDNGSGNGCDGTLETTLASAIAGRRLPNAGTYYLQVHEFEDGFVLSPYQLFVVVTTTEPTSEVEPNSNSTMANPIVTTGAPIGLRSGTISVADDEDLYSVTAVSGSTLYISADCDPERDASGTDVVVELLSTDGSTVLFTPFPGSSTSEPNSAEAFCFRFTFSGTFFVRVRSAAGGVGTYHLMAAIRGAGALHFASPSYTRVESAATASISVIRTGGSSGTVSVRFVTSDGTASAPSDYTAVTQTLTFPEGVTTQFVSVAISADATVESNETVNLTLSMPTGGATVGSPATAVLVILDDDESLDNGPANARPLDLSSGFTNVVLAPGDAPLAISPAGDEDWFSFVAPAGARVWAFVDTGGLQQPGANSRDSQVALFAADGTRLIEADDDDGTGNDCDETIEPEGDLASAIAGRTLPEGGTYYLRVRSFAEDNIIVPYKLYVAITRAAAVSESEPNNAPGFANALLTAGAAVGHRLGEIGSFGDVDIYSVLVPSNSLLFVSADCDLARDSAGVDLVVELLGTDGSTVLLVADSSGQETGGSESFCFRLAMGGRYFLRVHYFDDGGTGPYALLAIRTPAELEPNDTTASAGLLDLFAQSVDTRGSISPTSDQDYYSFVAPIGARAWFALDTGGAQGPGATTRNSLLTLLAPDGVSIVEEDDNDGSGNGCNGTLESGDASAIAGRSLAVGGTYFLRVRAVPGTGLVIPYRLFGVLTASTPLAEQEPNSSVATANPMVDAGVATALRSGAIAAPSDVDYYAVTASAGNILHISADGDPERDLVGTDLAVELISTDGAQTLFAANSSGVGSTTDPPGEAFCFEVPTTGTYYVRVRHASGGTGTYHLMVSRDNTELKITSQGILGTDVTVTFTSQSGRRYRVERADQLGLLPSWTLLPGTLSGTGRTLFYVDEGGASEPQRFYRVKQVP